jgi:hypothetical protein
VRKKIHEIFHINKDIFLCVHIYKDDQIFKLHMWHTFKIWQNIFKDNCHLFYSFIWMITTLGIDKKISKKSCHNF